MVYMLLCKIHCLEIYINVSSIHFSVPYRISWKRTQRKHSHVLLTGKLQQIKGLQLRWVFLLAESSRDILSVPPPPP